MHAAFCVGRVGALAVALGVGAAVATGVASADTPEPSDATSVSSATQQQPQPDTAAPPKRVRKVGPDLARVVRDIVERGVAVGSGGALTSGKIKDRDPKAEPEREPVAGEKSTPAPDKTKKSSRQVTLKIETRPHAPAAGDSTAPVAAKTTEKTSITADPDPVAARTVDTVARVAEAPAVTLRTLAPVVEVTKTAVATVASAVEAKPRQTLTSVLSNVLGAFGFGSHADNAPSGPMGGVPALALLAYGARRESEQSITPLAVQGTAAPLAATAVTTPPTVRVGWLTGANSINDTERRFGIAGTDVGVMWDNGITGDNPATQIIEQRQVLMAFGDTFSGRGMTGIWRNNVLLRSADGVLSDGLYVPDGIIHDPGAYSGSPMTDPNFAREIIGKYGYARGPEVTIIPTAAISVPGAGANGATRQYVQFMSVRSWDTPGRWTTNYSGISWSDDNGQNWTVVPASSIRPAATGRSTRPYIKGNENFQQGAFVKPPEGSPEAAAGWVYSYGTPAGRGGTVYLSRVNQFKIDDQTKYEYWNGTAWVKNQPSAAKPVLPGTTTSGFLGFGKKTTYPSAGEMSVQYNPYLKKYVMLYADDKNNVVMRTADRPEGTWSSATTLVTSTQYPGLYAPMIHPWSGTSQLKKADGSPEDPQYLYWGLSQWNEYNVALMRTDLSRV